MESIQLKKPNIIWTQGEYLLEFDMIEDLVKIIRDRKNSDPSKSYTSQLLSGGVEKCFDKLEEEIKELKEALNNKDNEIHEAADVIYHLLVSLEAANIKYEDIIKELKDREIRSGLEEKKNRKT